MLLAVHRMTLTVTESSVVKQGVRVLESLTVADPLLSRLEFPQEGVQKNPVPVVGTCQVFTAGVANTPKVDHHISLANV